MECRLDDALPPMRESTAGPTGERQDYARGEFTQVTAVTYDPRQKMVRSDYLEVEVVDSTRPAPYDNRTDKMVGMGGVDRSTIFEYVQADSRPELEGFLALLEMTAKFTAFLDEVIV